MNTQLLGATALVLALGGCASFTPDAGLGPATKITRAELNKDVVKVSDEAVATTTQERAEELLRRPLTPDSAVQIAILKNRGLQAAFNDLGVAEAVYVKATLPPAPRFSASRLAGSFELEIERQYLLGSSISQRSPSVPPLRSNAFGGRNSARRKRSCGSPRKRGGNTTARSPPTSRLGSCSRRSLPPSPHPNSPTAW